MLLILVLLPLAILAVILGIKAFHQVGKSFPNTRKPFILAILYPAGILFFLFAMSLISYMSSFFGMMYGAELILAAIIGPLCLFVYYMVLLHVYRPSRTCEKCGLSFDMDRKHCGQCGEKLDP